MVLEAGVPSAEVIIAHCARPTKHFDSKILIGFVTIYVTKLVKTPFRQREP
jgi:hypothetical protein